MILSIIIIGDEILIGQVTDTNSGAVARALGPQGWQVRRIVTVGDGREEIAGAVNEALADSDLVVTTGGLGPTKDDITKGVLTEIFGGELRPDPAVLDNIRHVFDLRGLAMNPLTEAQALVPTSCRVVQNRYGTAPIMWFERDGKVLVSMPGVPFETEGMLPEVVELIRQRFNPDIEIVHRSLMVCGITESALAQKLDEFESSLDPDLHLAYLPVPGLIRLRLDGTGAKGSDIAARHATAVDRLHDMLGPLMVYDGDATAAQIVLHRLRSLGMTLATAESCTGGNIAHSITEIPGSSDVYIGSVVSYSNDLKQRLLGVSRLSLENCGAVSREVVEQMAAGACRVTGADCAVATSGIAGPSGGTPDKPVGTVWIGWCVRGQVSSRLLHLPGNRGRVIDRATTEALIGLVKLC
ncbi:MAG: CinA family nicotinamide mononucleotide deamidase-related protein [Bacteroidales bacterium]|nr:CinA family nicotinamide mononucleotide deamidase-related protein [Bacteroidales bacterium]